MVGSTLSSKFLEGMAQTNLFQKINVDAAQKTKKTKTTYLLQSICHFLLFILKFKYKKNHKQYNVALCF